MIITFISIAQIQQFSFQMRLTTSILQDMYSSKILNVYKNIRKKTKTKQNRKPLREHCLTVEMSLTAGDLDDCLQRLIKLRLMLKIYRKIILPDDRQLHKHDLTKAGGPYGLRTS